MAGQTDDLASLAKLDEDVLMNELKVRYREDKIYTYVGDIVVAVNPFRDLGVYSKDYSDRYKMARRTDYPPHIFAVSDMAYQAMLGTSTTSPQNQCILISGESGAGKTESTKLIIKQLVTLCRGNSQLEQQIIQVNPLLEAFGNAQTVMNDNSSRFGRYIILKFQNGQVKGSKISEYLLEKSRMVHQGMGEQNFHVFYYMFAGLPQERQTKLQLDNPSSYRYFCDGASCLKSKPSVGILKQRYEELENALDIVGFDLQEQDDLFTILAGILNLGNIVIEEKEDYASVSTKGPLQKAVTLLGIKPADLEHTLTCSVTFTRGDQVRRNYSKAEAEDCRDAVAKAIYGRVFSWIVNKANSLLAPQDYLDPSHTQEIGILDIFGFEHFDQNSFEQACINLANEQLQAFFNKHIFQLEQEEYRREGIDWTEIPWKDNQPVLELFLAKPIGLLALLDEESLFPRGTDKTLVEKLNKKFDDHPCYIKSTHANASSFGIKHYAAPVRYKATGWLTKNRDTLPPGVMELLRESKNSVLSLIFKAQISRTGTLALQSRSKQKATTSRKAMRDAKETMARKLTVGGQFRNSLNILLERMNSSKPIFVRCIKPNTHKKAGAFDDAYVKRQLLYTGMLETIRIRRDGYAIRPTFLEFVKKYEILLNQFGAAPTPDNCRKILKCCSDKDWRIGKTKVFLRHGHLDGLSAALAVYAKKVLHIQKLVRGFLGRQRVRKLQALAAKEKRVTADFLALVGRLGINLQEAMAQKQGEDKTIEKGKLDKAAHEAFMKKQAEELALMEQQAAEERRKQAKVSFGTGTENAIRHDMASDPIGSGSGSEAEVAEDEFEPVKPKPKTMVSHTTSTNFVGSFSKKAERAASVRWFRETQMNSLVMPSGHFAEWFHGIIKRRDAEVLLRGMSIGCFLIRVGETRFGYTLSFKSGEKIRHYMIELTRSQKYVIVGEPKVHKNLNDLVNYYQTHELSNWNQVLGEPCGQEDGECDYADLVDDSLYYCDIESPQPRQSHHSHPPSFLALDVAPNAPPAPNLPPRNTPTGLAPPRNTPTGIAPPRNNRSQRPLPPISSSGILRDESYMRGGVPSVLRPSANNNEDPGTLLPPTKPPRTKPTPQTPPAYHAKAPPLQPASGKSRGSLPPPPPPITSTANPPPTAPALQDRTPPPPPPPPAHFKPENGSLTSQHVSAEVPNHADVIASQINNNIKMDPEEDEAIYGEAVYGRNAKKVAVLPRLNIMPKLKKVAKGPRRDSGGDENGMPTPTETPAYADRMPTPTEASNYADSFPSTPVYESTSPLMQNAYRRLIEAQHLEDGENDYMAVTDDYQEAPTYDDIL